MNQGRIEQVGAPLDLYDRPANLFVAQFIGSPAMNIVQGQVRRAKGAAFVESSGGMRWPLALDAAHDGRPVAYGVRPENVTLTGSAEGGVPAEVIVVEPTGAETEFVAKTGEATLTLVTQARAQSH